MKRFDKIIFLMCGLLLMLAAVPVFAQERIEINKMPFNDFAQMVKERVEQKKVDLTKPFSVELEGVLMKDGKLDTKKSKFIKSEGDAAMTEVGKSFIEAVSDSGFFSYLRNLGVEKINFTLSQDESQITAIIKSETATAERAMTTASGFSTLMRIAKMQSKNKDEKFLLYNSRVVADGKSFVIEFAALREDVQELIKRNFEKSAAKPSGK